MESPSGDEVTALLHAWSAGDKGALDRLTAMVYQDLHRAATRYMAGERSSHTLQTTALIHEVYIRLVDVDRIEWQNRAHFLAICARMMRRILVDWARERGYKKRGAGAVHVSLDEALTLSPSKSDEMVALDDALHKLEDMDARKGQVVELRFFGGLSVDETAEALRVSAETVMRDWRLAKVWLLRELSREDKKNGS
jgi:RNA polymerase sigma factor (TIGR02999 family)